MKYSDKVGLFLSALDDKRWMSASEVGRALRYPRGQEVSRTSNVLKRMANEDRIESIWMHNLWGKPVKLLYRKKVAA